MRNRERNYKELSVLRRANPSQGDFVQALQNGLGRKTCQKRQTGSAC
jgi:hypothetical protein